ncbi:ATP-binding protein [Thermospira aquatica]|uniref:histidine kinase n=1 Tax=Thermospira aquatica TaxID=2828656 RepID=A0AAX3BDS5_9SPIR|nr:ATP-binding protein [Thermospira aquatica]URA10477.1 ATP-binding protein [Thermospira aquatica]
MHATLTDILYDLVQNAIEAKASLVTLDYLEEKETLTCCIGDNGVGMTPDEMKQAVDPFYTNGEKHAKRKVGLGLPFAKQLCETVGGEFLLDSRKDEGTSVALVLPKSHVDMPPVGDLVLLFVQVMGFDGEYEMLIHRKLGERSYRVVRSELREAVGGFETAESLSWAKFYITKLEEELKEEVYGKNHA